MAGNQVALSIYSVANYNFGTKAAKVEKDANVSERLARMEQKCAPLMVRWLVARLPRQRSTFLIHGYV